MEPHRTLWIGAIGAVAALIGACEGVGEAPCPADDLLRCRAERSGNSELRAKLDTLLEADAEAP